MSEVPNGVYVWKAKDGWRWNKYSQGRLISESGEAYESYAWCRERATEEADGGAVIVLPEGARPGA